jgi:hypothetical protein
MKNIFLFVFFWISILASAQTSFRPGISAGTTFSYPDRQSEFSEGFFSIYRSGLQGGFTTLVTVNNNFVFKSGLLYSTQSVGMRGDGSGYKTDIRVNSDNLLLPLQFGYQNKLGSLILRELIGVTFMQNVKRNNVVTIEAQNQGAIPEYTISEVRDISFMPMLNFGLELGSIFNNDAGFFIGVHYRQGFSRMYQFNYNSSYVNEPQFFSTKSSFIAIELTYYFSRPSYWFKKEFEY